MAYGLVMANLNEYPAASRSPSRRGEEEPQYGRPEHRKHKPDDQMEARQCR
jgi:hypothetical protein